MKSNRGAEGGYGARMAVSSAFGDGVFVKFNYPPQDETNMKEEGPLSAVCREMDR